MAKTKLSAKNIAILTATTTGLGVSVTLGISYIMEWPTIWTMALVNTLANAPLLLASSDALRQELGLRSPVQIIGNSSRSSFGRRIPINAGDKSTDIFMQTLRLAPPKEDNENEIATLETISVWYDDNEYQIALPELSHFIDIAWKRQRQGSNGFSREFWTKQHRPRLKTLEYNLRMLALMNCQGLIINRAEGRSGRLTLSPAGAMKVIKQTYM